MSNLKPEFNTSSFEFENLNFSWIFNFQLWFQLKYQPTFWLLDWFWKLTFPITFSSPDHDFIFHTLLIVILNSIKSFSRSHPNSLIINSIEIKLSNLKSEIWNKNILLQYTVSFTVLFCSIIVYIYISRLFGLRLVLKVNLSHTLFIPWSRFHLPNSSHHDS